MDAWRSKAACMGMDVNLFFPPGEDLSSNTTRLGRKGWHVGPRMICADCPVQAECLAEQLSWEAQLGTSSENDPHGIFGGTIANHRRVLKKVNVRRVAAA